MGEKRRVAVRGLEMAYTQSGEGGPIVFLHGNPTSSYLWRNVIPHLEGQGRCVAPDLIGMGDSDKLSDPSVVSYGYAQHRQYLDAFLDAVVPEGPITFVIHDWGSALGFDWIRRHPERVRGVAYMEAIVNTVQWSDLPEGWEPVFRELRSPAGEDMVLAHNFFVEQLLPQAILRKLSDQEMDAYRAPFLESGEGRRAMLTWSRQVPIAGEPVDVIETVEANADFMSETAIPKLFVNVEPGQILVGRMRDFARSWPNQEEVTVRGLHFVQEDSPDEIGRAVSEWLKKI